MANINFVEYLNSRLLNLPFLWKVEIAVDIFHNMLCCDMLHDIAKDYSDT